MKKPTTIQRVLAPLAPATFARTYFERAPLLIRGRPGKFDFLFRQEQFKDGLDQVSEIRAVFPGLWQATIGPGDIKEMMRAGATICVTGMELAHAALGRAARAIRRELRYPGEVSFRSYLSPRGSGFDLHYDARVATTLQLAGRKRWWYSAAPAMPFPPANSPRPLVGSGVRRPRQRDLRSVVLEPGDLLCLPAGTWHQARAQEMSLSLNLAFDHNHASVIDRAADLLDARLAGDPAWRRPLPIAPGASAARVPAEVAAELTARLLRMEQELAAIRRDPQRLRALWWAMFGR